MSTLAFSGPPILVWDLDGNLIDSVHSRDGCAKDFADVLRGAYKLSDEQYRSAIDYYIGPGCGVRIEEQVPRCLDLLGLPKDREEECVQGYLERIYSTVYPLYQDVVPCLEELKSLGYDRNCISTSMKTEFTFSDGRENDHLTETVRTNCLDKYIGFWFGGTRKQENKLYHKGQILEALGIRDEDFKKRSCLIGDAENDMKIAAAWGITLPIYVNRRMLSMHKIKKTWKTKK